jgi:ribosomal protein S18 acetylase RimI-like enzyme
VIRPATVEDAAAIASIQARGWRWAYGDFIAPEDMPVAAESEPAFRELVATGTVRVFDQDGTVVGYASVADDELTSLYVDPSAQGAGVGRRLLADAEERIRTAGHGCAWLYVYADNGQGRAFYERHGWRLVGGLVGEGRWRAPGYRYERDLPPTALAPDAEPPGGGTPWA